MSETEREMLDEVNRMLRQKPSKDMTLGEYAAIHLKVPTSGTDWLDEMIREANRNELAAKAMQGHCANMEYLRGVVTTAGRRGMSIEEAEARVAYEVADRMLAERGRK